MRYQKFCAHHTSSNQTSCKSHISVTICENFTSVLTMFTEQLYACSDQINCDDTDPVPTKLSVKSGSMSVFLQSLYCVWR